MGIGYLAGIKNDTGASVAVGYGGGLLLTLAIIVFLRRRSYGAGIRVEAWRDQAVALRLSDPDTYGGILGQAQGSEAAAAANRDPDAYVALFLSHANEVGFDVEDEHDDFTAGGFGGFPCVACGQHRVSVEGDGALWVCSGCAANGPIVEGVQIDIGLRGSPRDDTHEQYRPRVPLATQLAEELPELAVLSATDAARLDLAFYDWCFQLFGTSFDIPDDDVRAAEAVNARNVLDDPHARQDEARFYTLTALSTAGWQWRRAEQMGHEPSAPEVAHRWAEKYLSGRTVAGRSEAIGLTAAAIVECEDLERLRRAGSSMERFSSKPAGCSR